MSIFYGNCQYFRLMLSWHSLDAADVDVDVILKPVNQAQTLRPLELCKLSLCSSCVHVCVFVPFGLFIILRIRRMWHGTSDGALNVLNCRTDVRVVLKPAKDPN